MPKVETSAPRRKLIRGTVGLAEDINAVAELCRLQLRPSSIAYLVDELGTCFTEAEIGRIYREVNGVAASKGPLRHSAKRMISSLEQRTHASWIGNRLERLSSLKFDRVNLFIRLYRDYLDAFEATPATALLSSSYVLMLIRALQVGELVMQSCRHCTARFAHITNTPISIHTCPVCQVLKSRGTQTAPRRRRAAAG